MSRYAISAEETALRPQLVHYGRSLFQRGYSSGGSGNISVKLADGGFLVTPTNSCLGELEIDSLSRLDASGEHIGGDRPSKEVPMHMAFYQRRPACGAVVRAAWSNCACSACGVSATAEISPRRACCAMRVWMPPGCTHSTRTPLARSSSRSASEKPRTAALLAL